jgi:iron complex transport system substrate-binding protein
MTGFYRFICTSGLILMFLLGTPAAAVDDRSANGTADTTLTVIDDFGERVEIPAPPQRIVSLAPSNTEILYAMDLGDRIVGVTDYCNYPNETENVGKIGGFSTVDVERVISLKPDLIVASQGNTEEVVDQLRALGLTVITLYPDNIQGVLDDIDLIGEATGSQEKAAELILDLQQRIDAVTEKTGTLTEKPSAVHVVWHDPIYVSGTGTFQDMVMTMAGAENAFSDIEQWGIIGLEEFIAADPDIIIVNSGNGMGDNSEHIIYGFFLNEPRMQQLTAVRNQRIYIIDSDIIDRSGPRIVDALEIVAGMVHPELFGSAVADEASPPAQSPGFAAGAGILATAVAMILIYARKK